MSDLFYPTEKMSAIAQQIRSQLDTALQEHNTTLTNSMTNTATQLPDKTGSLFLAILSVLGRPKREQFMVRRNFPDNLDWNLAASFLDESTS